MPLRRTTAPVELPLTLADARAHLRVLDTSEDAQVTAWIGTATEQMDGKDGLLGRALVTQSWELLLDRFPCGSEIRIPLPPLQSVQSVTYVDTAGVTQTLPTSVYAVDAASAPGVVSLKYAQVWPATRDERNAVTIAFTCGYGAAASVPERLKSAIKLLIGDLYAHREAQGEPLSRNATVDALILPFRVF